MLFTETIFSPTWFIFNLGIKQLSDISNIQKCTKSCLGKQKKSEWDNLNVHLNIDSKCKRKCKKIRKKYKMKHIINLSKLMAFINI